MDNDVGAGRMFLNISLDSMGFMTFIVFLILKVTGTWPEISWFWVFFPLWIGVAVGLALTIILAIIAFFILRS